MYVCVCQGSQKLFGFGQADICGESVWGLKMS